MDLLVPDVVAYLSKKQGANEDITQTVMEPLVDENLAVRTSTYTYQSDTDHEQGEGKVEIRAEMANEVPTVRPDGNAVIVGKFVAL